MHFQCFASGSDGNCYFVGDYNQGILIDAGIGIRTIQRDLRALNMDVTRIRGVFVTHDHTDHARTVSALANKHSLPIYTTKGVHEGMDSNYKIHPKVDRTCRRYVEKGQPLEIIGLRITPFGVDHDSTDCVGYCIEGNGFTLTLATDVGKPNEQLAACIERSDILILEANYDAQMLQLGPYPYHLKHRIASGNGHLDNKISGQFIAEHWHPGLRQVLLCHLSQINNKPETAVQTVEACLKERGIRPGEDVTVTALNRLKPSKLYQLGQEQQLSLNI